MPTSGIHNEKIILKAIAYVQDESSLWYTETIRVLDLCERFFKVLNPDFQMID